MRKQKEREAHGKKSLIFYAFSVIIIPMDEERNNSIENNEPESASAVESGAASAPVANDADKRKARVKLGSRKAERLLRAGRSRSIVRRTMLNYFLYSVIILLLLWAVFFFGMYGFYGPMLRREIEEVGREAVAAMPKRVDDNGLEIHYRDRLTGIARANDVAIVLFRRGEAAGDFEKLIIADAMGEGAENIDTVFDAIIECGSYDKLFVYDGAVETLDTSAGKFLCFGSVRQLDDSSYSKKVELQLLVIRPYSVFNAQTMKILYTLIICTGIVLVFSCLFAYFASRFQTKRLADFSQKAKKLAGGDKHVVFSGDGYDEYENLAAALNDATEKMERSERLQHDIIANVSHDIRTPLTMIRAYAEMLRDMPLDENKRKRTADVIISEADRLTTLTRDALNYSRLQSGVVEFKFERCDFSALANNVLGQFEIFKERNGMTFVADIDRNINVVCDKQHIEQVLYNLINNAINYCGDDKTVILSVKRTDGAVHVEVSDHGRGIAPEELDAVWDRYYRTAHAKRTAVGTGLGLSICKNILVAHNAEFGVKSVVGSGTTFWFDLLL